MLWVLLFSGLFELAMIVFLLIAHRAMQAEEQARLRLEGTLPKATAGARAPVHARS